MKEKIDSWWESIKAAINGDGSPLTAEFLRKNLGKILLILFILYSHVQMRYTHEEVIGELGVLKRQLADVRYTSIATWGELTSKNKPEIVRSKISDNAQLISADEPPIEVD